MNITIEKNKEEVSLKVTNNGIECIFNGISTDNLKQLREQIDEALQKPKSTIMVWNPRSMKHDIIEP
jgi:molybdopterin biosynthesis enzyme